MMLCVGIALVIQTHKGIDEGGIPVWSANTFGLPRPLSSDLGKRRCEISLKVFISASLFVLLVL